MLRLALAVLLSLALTAPAFAQDEEEEPAAPAAEPAKAPAAKADKAPAAAAAPAMDPFKVGPISRPIKKPAAIMKEVNAFLKKDEQAMKKHDLATSMALIDFPVWMATDDSTGEAGGMVATQEQWEAMMKPFFDQPPPKGMKMTRKNAVTLLSPSMATVVSTYTMKMGKKKATFKSAGLLIKKGGAWKYSVMAEAGWGEMMKEGQPEE
jgi:hypothetical protein